MNNQIIRFSLLLSIGIFFGSTHAELPKSDMPKVESNKIGKKAMATKIAFVNLNRIVTIDPNLIKTASDEWREFYDDLQKKIQPVDEELRKLKDKFEKAKQEFEEMKKGGLMSNEAMQRQYEEAAKLEYELSRKGYDRDQFVREELEKGQKMVGPKIEKAVKELRINQGWDMVIRGEYILDAENKFDLTDQVLEKINKEFAAEKAKKEVAKKEAESKA